jgi:hypothetical protein
VPLFRPDLVRYVCGARNTVVNDPHSRACVCLNVCVMCAVCYCTLTKLPAEISAAHTFLFTCPRLYDLVANQVLQSLQLARRDRNLAVLMAGGCARSWLGKVVTGAKLRVIKTAAAAAAAAAAATPISAAGGATSTPAVAASSGKGKGAAVSSIAPSTSGVDPAAAAALAAATAAATEAATSAHLVPLSCASSRALTRRLLEASVVPGESTARW